MLHSLAISGYRSLKSLLVPLGRLNLITGPNGSGKSNIYRSLRLLADTAEGRLIRSLAREGGLQSTLWAGPEQLSPGILRGEVPVQGQVRKKPISLRLGFASDGFCYSIELGLPSVSQSAFSLDPVIKRECLWRGHTQLARNLVVDRRKQLLRCRGGRSKAWESIELGLTNNSSMLTEYADPDNAPELLLLRDAIRSWRFYDHFRTDAQAPVRQNEIAAFTPALASDGADLEAAIQTIREVGDSQALATTISDAFPGSEIVVQKQGFGLQLALNQPGMLRPLTTAELSDGTLRYLFLTAALLTPRPPELMVLNEPETSLHPDLVPALGRMIRRYSEQNQILVVSHSQALIEALSADDQCSHFQLEKNFGATQLLDVDPFSLPQWEWPAR